MIRHAPSIGIGIGLSLRSQGAAGAAFSGLLDQYPGAAAAYSLRALSSGWVAGDVVRARRVNTPGEANFTAGQVANGELATWALSGDAFVTTWYDQSGNANNAVQATTTKQPKIVDAGSLVTGGLDFDNIDNELVTINTDSFGTSSRSIFAVCSPASVGANTDAIVQLSRSTDVGGGWFFSPEVATRANATTWISSTPASTSSNNLITGIYTTGNLHSGNSMWLDGSSITRTSGNDGAIDTGTSTILIGNGATGTTPFDGMMAEIIIYKSDQSANRVAIETNINAEYSIYV